MATRETTEQVDLLAALEVWAFQYVDKSEISRIKICIMNVPLIWWHHFLKGSRRFIYIVDSSTTILPIHLRFRQYFRFIYWTILPIHLQKNNTFDSSTDSTPNSSTNEQYFLFIYWQYFWFIYYWILHNFKKLTIKELQLQIIATSAVLQQHYIRKLGGKYLKLILEYYWPRVWSLQS